MKKRVLLITTGGTIAMKSEKNALAPQLGAEELKQLVPGLSEICDVSSVELFCLDSTNIGHTHWLKMAQTVREHYDDFDGFVITHGTDTMAYTAAALSYLIQNPKKPIVITGSQKPVETLATDSATNLLDSFIYATTPKASGVVIVFDGSVILGSRAKKTRSKSFNAFSSINYPDLAVIIDGRTRSYIEIKPKFKTKFYDKLDPKVGLFKLIPSADSAHLEYLLRHNSAVIIESFGVGGLPEDSGYFSILDKYTAKGKIIVMTTQVMSEGSDIGVYSVGQPLLDRQILQAYDMTLEAVVSKLMWILPQTKKFERVKTLFYKEVAHDISIIV